MRFVCISVGKGQEGVVLPVIGNVYTLLESRELKGKRLSGNLRLAPGTYYEFIELPHWYYHDQFVKINEDQKDETEMKREYNHEPATNIF